MSTDKLPEWPENPIIAGDSPANEWCVYWMETADAALARMEALVAVVRKAGPYAHSRCIAGGIVGFEDAKCTCGLSELLAACERRKS